MQFGTRNTEVHQDNGRYSNQKSKGSKRSPFTPGLRKIMQRGRLSEKDLEILRLDILRTHKNKHYRVLAISAIIFICLGLLIYFLIL